MKRIKNIVNAVSSRPLTLVLVLCACIAFTVLIKYRWRENKWIQVVQSDGCGYYAYLPAVFIYQDLQYRFYLDLKDKYHFGDLSENFLYTENNRLYNRYFCGTAIAMAPFFLLGWLMTVITGGDADGHSFWFHVSVNVAALFYVLAGLYVLSFYLRRFFSMRIIAIASSAIFLGTNLFNYTVYDSSYSHAYSFGFICAFITLADISIRKKTRKSFILLALCSGMIAIIRPTNAIVLLSLPFIAGSWAAFTEWLRTILKPINMIPAVISGILVVGIQSLMYFLQCGSWWTDGYPYENFYFDRPELINMWFSYRAGVLLWSPVVIISLAGLFFVWRKNKFMVISFLLFMFINSWIISSWWAWHYAGTFGMRPMVDHMSWCIVLLCFSIQALDIKWLRIAMAIPTILLVFIGHILNYQKVRDMIPWDNMTRAKYNYIFLKTNYKYSFDLYDPYFPPTPVMDNILVRHFAFENSSPSLPDFSLPEKYFFSDTLLYPGTGNATIASIDPGNMKGSERYYVDLRTFVFYPELNEDTELSLQFKNGSEIIHAYSTHLIEPQFEVNKWNPIRFSFYTHIPMTAMDHVEIVIRNGNQDTFHFQKMEFTLASF